MIRGVEVGAHQWVTMCQLENELPDNLALAMVNWRDTTFGALGAVSAVLDERIALEEILEDVIFVSKGQPVATADMESLVRGYRPYRMTAVEAVSLGQLQEDPELVRNVGSSLRWYLRAVRQGPSPDGVVLMWIALEGLSAARSTSPKSIEAELAQLGWDVNSLPISIGRLAGLRADIVHGGAESSPMIYEGYYVLETVTRSILRGRLAAVSTWPAEVASNLFDSPWESRVEDAWSRPTVEWHDGALPEPEITPEAETITWGIKSGSPRRARMRIRPSSSRVPKTR